MSYFKGLKLTKKGEQLQAKINGNLSETLVFTRAEVGSGELTNDDELRFLTALKSSWGNAVISKCELQGEEQTRVAIELQFNNAELTEDKIFREIGLFARGNDGQEVLYAYSNAAEQYDYIPQMKDSPHTFIITIYFYITNGTKVDANIDLNSYISLKKFNEEMDKKANKTDRANENNYGLVKYGTEENTALEGDKINQIVGKDYGGVLNTPGEKYEGKVYYDRNTKKLFLCKRNNSDISANINNYIGLDNNSLLDRLENLYNVKTYSYHNTEDVNSDMYIHYNVLKIMNICILEIKFARVANRDVVMPATALPDEFRPKNVEYLSAIASTGGIKMDYHWLRLEPNGHFYTHNNAGITVRNLQTTIAYIAAN